MRAQQTQRCPGFLLEPRKALKWRIVREFGWTPDYYDSLSVKTRDEVVGFLGYEAYEAKRKANMKGGG